MILRVILEVWSVDGGLCGRGDYMENNENIGVDYFAVVLYNTFKT